MHPSREFSESTRPVPKDELDFLKRQLAETESLLSEALSDQARMIRDHEGFRDILDDLFVEFDRMSKRHEDRRGSKSSISSNRRTSGDKGKAGRPSVRTLRRDPILARLEHRKTPFSIEPPPQAFELWGRFFGNLFPEKLRIKMQITDDSAERNLAGYINERDSDGLRRFEVSSGQAIRLLHGGSRIPAFGLRLGTSGGETCIAQLQIVLASESGSSVQAPSVNKPRHREGRTLLEAMQLSRSTHPEDATQYFEKHATGQERCAIHVLRANLAQDDRAWIGHVNRYLSIHGMNPIDLRPADSSRFHRLESTSTAYVDRGPLVSVIMAAYNAHETLECAAQSILQQTWRPIELIIVDDASTDNTYSLARQLTRKDHRVKLLRNAEKVGPHVAYNLGLALAKGAYVTSHDADDWAHPERILCQLEPILLNPDQIRGTRGMMIRMTLEGEISRLTQASDHSPDGACQPANISCFFDHTFLKKDLGFRDSVRMGADSEIYSRASHLLGKSFCELERLCLFCLDATQGISNHPLYGSNFSSALWKNYLEAFLAWHASLDPDDAALPFPHRQDQRRFPAPAPLIVPDYLIEKALVNDSAASE